MSSLRYLPGRYNRASGTRNAFGALSDELVAEGLPPMTVLDGDREKADQLRIWYQRMTLTPGNRKVYGTAKWQGKTWYRIHPDAVGVPDTSNHEKRRANDLGFPYNSNSAAHRRAQVLAKRHNITCEGMGFKEWWHWTFWGPLGTIDGTPAGGSTSKPAGTAAPITPIKEDDMRLLYITDNVDGNNHPGWALFNVRTGKWHPLVDDRSTKAQENANSWARVLDQKASFCTRQDVLNVAAGIRATS